MKSEDVAQQLIEQQSIQPLQVDGANIQVTIAAEQIYPSRRLEVEGWARDGDEFNKMLSTFDPPLLGLEKAYPSENTPPSHKRPTSC
jgi:hypothetical protein